MSQISLSLSPSQSTVEEKEDDDDRVKENGSRSSLTRALSHLKINRKKTKQQQDEHHQQDHKDHDHELFLPSHEVNEKNAETVTIVKPAQSSTGTISPLSKSSSSLNIFERSVQDQFTISRRSSFNQNLQLTASLSLSPAQTVHTSPPLSSCNCSSKIPDHLTSECYVPTCLDATTEALTHDKLENLEVIQSTNLNLVDILDQAYCNNMRRKSRSAPLTRRHSSVIPPYQSQNPFTSIRSSSSSRPIEIDFSDHKRLNFCSYANFLLDEIENCEIDPMDLIDTQLTTDSKAVSTGSNFSLGPRSRKNSSILITPALSLTKTGSIRE